MEGCESSRWEGKVELEVSEEESADGVGVPHEGGEEGSMRGEDGGRGERR